MTSYLVVLYISYDLQQLQY